MTRFAVWAPSAGTAEAEVDGVRHAMHHAGRPGWWEAAVDTSADSDYAFVLDSGAPLPDPRSPWQPHGVHGPSRLVDHAAFPWSDEGWRGLPLPGAVLYELHVGTFTSEGTFAAAVGRLDHLVDLGVDCVEVMPVAAFPGRHGWGYDGVALWAVHEPYGGPLGFKQFVDACHARNIGVVLDVVYNHLGPSGNYLHHFGPYFTRRHTTPWGTAVNLADAGSDEVRRFIVDNAVMWLRDYHVDGLRLDAVHALVDERATHLLEQLAVEVDALATAVRRPLSLIAESDLNDARLVTPRQAGGYGLTAQWDDDIHHALHALLTGERQGYYADFGSLACLATTLQRVFWHAGTWSSFRGRTHGRLVDVDAIPAHRFLAYLQNHDQVGNRATGDRLSATLSPELLKVGAALVLTAPYTPMLFMGEEWGAATPWQFFTDHQEPALATAVREGRRAEFARHGWDAADVPDPQASSTVERSRLDWAELTRQPHADVLDFYRRLIALRREVPALTDPRLNRLQVRYDEDAQWLVVHRGRLRVIVNLAVHRQAVPVDGVLTAVLLASSSSATCLDRAVQLDGPAVAIVELA
ncbi:MAG: malto-oligosyltrehalose trehalohydrolase [Actinomycetota bacterium]|nr:malto-oligosyltrehalose trehalohydrolase [Actinomycetota bacterium]